MKKARLGSGGFSLLELLIGITMLAIIVVPVLHAFLTSSKTSVKAREVRNQTVAAQNILEIYESTDIARLIGDLEKYGQLASFNAVAQTSALYAYDPESGGYEQVTAGSADSGDGPAYKIVLTGVGDGKYDAVLSISAAKYSRCNSVGIVDYKPMDAVYIQPEPGDDSNPDVIAAKDFASQAQIDSGIEWDYHYFLDKMARTVTVTARKIGGQSGVVSCTAQFSYETRFVYTLTDDSTEPPTVTVHERDYTADITSDFYSGSYTEGGDCLYGLYFFYYPNPSPAVDNIEVVNRDNIDMSVYLIRQTAVAADPDIILREKYDPTTTPPHAKLFYNRAQHSYRYYIGYPGSGGGFSDYWYNTYTFNGSLIDTPVQNRLYGVTVELYKAGSIDEDGGVAGTPLAAFNASSLE